jgi:hypothetical protein
MDPKITDAQKASIRDSLQIYFDLGSQSSLAYLRFCPLSTKVFPHGLSIGVRVPAGDIEFAKDKVTDFLVEAFECLLSSTESETVELNTVAGKLRGDL